MKIFPWVQAGTAAGKSHGLRHANVWLGEAGTITALHFDSYDNFLLQLHGRKYVRLYDQHQTKHLCATPSSTPSQHRERAPTILILIASAHPSLSACASARLSTVVGAKALAITLAMAHATQCLSASVLGVAPACE